MVGQVVREGRRPGMVRSFLDSTQYSTTSILRYERFFGPGYVSTGGAETTKVAPTPPPPPVAYALHLPRSARTRMPAFCTQQPPLQAQSTTRLLHHGRMVGCEALAEGHAWV